MKRPVNEGFSGGEKKRNEIFQMAVLEPQLAILDETDSGPRHRRAAHRGRAASTSCAAPSARCWWSRTTSACSNYIVPDFVHVLVDGRIVRSGGKEMALELEEKGYAWLEKEPAPAGRSALHERRGRREGPLPRRLRALRALAGRRGRAGLAARAAHGGLRALRGARLADAARRGLAPHARGAARPRPLRAGRRARSVPAEPCSGRARSRRPPGHALVFVNGALSRPSCRASTRSRASRS